MTPEEEAFKVLKGLGTEREALAKLISQYVTPQMLDIRWDREPAQMTYSVTIRVPILTFSEHLVEMVNHELVDRGKGDPDAKWKSFGIRK